jgi:hypothetical protein
MEARQEEFNARVNLMMSVEVCNLHHIQDGRSCDLLDPRLGNDLRLLPNRLFQVAMWCKHRIILPIAKVKITYLKSWDQSQLWSYYAYPFREVRHNECVFKIPQDPVMTNHASQGRDVVGQDRRYLLCIR